MNKKKASLVIPKDLRERMKSLSNKERLYFQMMWPKSGVLYLTSKPGVAKSAIIREIAYKMGFNYYDIRLSSRDETDLGVYPDKIEINGKKYLDFITPLWAHEANKRRTIIHWEEANRAEKQVRNAAMQMFLERTVGLDFKFNDDVLMVASGNLGDEDGTDVEEFDTALNGRLIHFNHVLEPEEWIENFATENIHPIIVSFIERYPDYMYRDPVADGDIKHKAYASPRTWEFLSDYIIANYGTECEVLDFIEDIKVIGYSYIGPSILKFISFCEKQISFTIQDVINNFDNIKEDLLKANRDRLSELIQNLKPLSIEHLTKLQRDNIHSFLGILSEEELTDYVIGSTLDKTEIKKFGVNTKEFFKRYQEILLKASSLNMKNKKEGDIVLQRVKRK